MGSPLGIRGKGGEGGLALPSESTARYRYLSDPFTQDVGFIDSPRIVSWLQVRTAPFIQIRVHTSEPNEKAYYSLLPLHSEHIISSKLRSSDRIETVPAHSSIDDVRWEMTPFERRLGVHIGGVGG